MNFALPQQAPIHAPHGTPATDAAIELQDVVFGWNRAEPVLAVRNLRVRAGERVLLRGPSGSGKSTLLGLIGGVLAAQEGQVRVLGVDLGALAAASRDAFRAEHIGYVFQMFNLIPYLTVRENVLLPALFSSRRRRSIEAAGSEAEAERLLSALGLRSERLIARKVVELSIGQQQRVAAARALLGRPALVIADEPTSALDADARTGFLELLMRECESFGITLLFASHDRELAPFFDRVVALQDINGASPGAGA